jgi:FkbM family methyltransferase
VSFPIADAREMCHVESLGGERRLLQRWIQELHPGDVAYDVGANIGLWSVLMAKVVGDKGLVVSFEPETRALCQLRRNLDINGLGNVRPFGVALGNQEGAVELFVDDRVESGVHNLVRSSDGTWIQSAEMVVGDQFIAKSALPVPNVIKIDVEGAEYQVMLGLASALCRPECRAVCCEVHFGILDSTDQNDMPTKIERLLDEAGFRTKQWVDHSHLLAYKRSR